MLDPALAEAPVPACVRDHHDVPPVALELEQVVGGGDDNILAGLKPGTVIIEMSSGVPSVTQELAEKVQALGGLPTVLLIAMVVLPPLTEKTLWLNGS